ncbi:hypothetical protein HNQ10_000200 [Deinococcus metallilatus]|uniref:Type II secretion system protein n=1 Tax=Deinococcus metallilatus TaxID=1211322 RepID=A0ABR6MNB0_9DEIO|nr:hypothetical protein [Deinococcus metallilatus]GMA15392.1 hypothetical protein GCM10025871_17230 [Deinococcus metallilatus]
MRRLPKRSLSLGCGLFLAVLGLLLLAYPFANSWVTERMVAQDEQAATLLRVRKVQVLQACEAHLHARKVSGHVLLPPQNSLMPSGYMSRLSTGNRHLWTVSGEWQDRAGTPPRFFTCSATEDEHGLRINHVNWN